MTLYQDTPMITIHMVGCHQSGGWLVVATNPTKTAASEFNLRLNAVIAYRLYENVLHVFTTGQTFALAAVGQLRADAADRVIRQAADILGNATTEEAA